MSAPMATTYSEAVATGTFAARGTPRTVEPLEPFAFIHTLHYALERNRALPTYQQFREMNRTDSFLGGALLGPARRAVAEAVGEGVPEYKARDAMRWRVGNAYYSFLREVYVIVVLRDLGVDVRYHVLADALYAVDCWCADIVVSMFIGNARFKDRTSGRKPRPQQIFRRADPPLRFVDVELPVTPQFGVVHLPSRETVRAVADRIRGML